MPSWQIRKLKYVGNHDCFVSDNLLASNVSYDKGKDEINKLRDQDWKGVTTKWKNHIKYIKTGHPCGFYCEKKSWPNY